MSGAVQCGAPAACDPQRPCTRGDNHRGDHCHMDHPQDQR